MGVNEDDDVDNVVMMVKAKVANGKSEVYSNHNNNNNTNKP